MKVLVLAVVTVVLSSSAHAVIVDFGDSSALLPYAEDGFTFTRIDPPASVLHFLVPDNTALRIIPGLDDEGEGNNNGLASVELTRNDGIAFDINSFDVLTRTQIDGQFTVESSKGGSFVL